MYRAPAHAANATTVNPGITREAKERPPLVLARKILLIVLVESPARIGKIASAALIFPDATSEATEIAAECVSTKPATAAAKIMPVSPNHSQGLRATDAKCHISHFFVRPFASIDLRVCLHADVYAGGFNYSRSFSSLLAQFKRTAYPLLQLVRTSTSKLCEED